MRERIEATLDRFGVRFDSWFSERSLHGSGELERSIEALRARGHVYESEGAVWLRTTEFGDDKDRVLIRSDGEPTYFARRHRLPPRQARAGRGPAGRPAGRRPPRLRGADAGGDRGARRRPRPLRGAADPVRSPGRGHGAGPDVQAERRVRDPGRADRRHRRRRGAIPDAAAKPRDHGRPGPRARATPVAGQPRLLRPVRARPDREHPAQGGGRRRAPAAADEAGPTRRR